MQNALKTLGQSCKTNGSDTNIQVALSKSLCINNTPSQFFVQNSNQKILLSYGVKTKHNREKNATRTSLVLKTAESLSYNNHPIQFIPKERHLMQKKIPPIQLFCSHSPNSFTLHPFPSLLSSIQPHQAKKLIPRLLPLLNTPQHTTRNSARTRLLHAPHNHTQMTTLHDHRHTLGFQDLHYGVCDVLG